MLTFHPHGVLPVLAGLFAWSFALWLFVTNPGRTANRRLALALTVEGAYFLGLHGLPFFTNHEPTAAGLVAVGHLALLCVGLAYLNFLGTIDSPATAWLRRAGPWVTGLAASGLVGLVFVNLNMNTSGALHQLQLDQWLFAWFPDTSDLSQTQQDIFFATFMVGILIVIASSLLGLFASMYAWKHATGPARQRNLHLMRAFLVRDVGYVLVFTTVILQAIEQLAVPWRLFQMVFAVPAAVQLLFVPMAVYAILRSQILGLELTTKWIAPKALALGAMGLSFAVLNEVLETLLPAMNTPGTIILAVSLGGAFVPLQRALKTSTDKWWPDAEDPDHVQQRREEILRDAMAEMMADGELSDDERSSLQRLGARLGLAGTQIEQMAQSDP